MKTGATYHYGARNYDAALGRFMTLDPDAEKYAFQSPYVYADNNSVKFIDLDGKSTVYKWDVPEDKIPSTLTTPPDEWIQFSTGETVKVGDKGGAKTDYITRVNADGSITQITQAGGKIKATNLEIAKNPDGEIKQYNPNTWAKMKEDGGFIGRVAYESANGVYTTGQLLMFRSIGASEVVNLDRTITNSEQGLNGLISTTLLGAEYAQGIKMAAGGLKTMSSSTQGWMKFNSEFRFRPDFNPSVNKMTLKGIEYKRMININNTMIESIKQGSFILNLVDNINNGIKNF